MEFLPIRLKQYQGSSDEIKNRYQLWNTWLIKYQIPRTFIIKIVWQTVRRITNKNFGVKEFKAPNFISSDFFFLDFYSLV